MPPSLVDERVRLLAVEFLDRQVKLYGDVLPKSVLSRGFDFEGTRVPLISPQGIFKPRVMIETPLSITTAPPIEGKARPYDDHIGEDGLLRYRYRGTDINHRDNAGLRLAMTRRVPLIYLHGIVPGEYLAFWPVYIVGDDPAHLSFTVAVDDVEATLAASKPVPDGLVQLRRAYVTREVQQRVHQRTFQRRVLLAYKEKCAICRLGHHRRLLDAAHILPDKHPMGEPLVSNGLALCKLHHAAFDGNLLGIRPDLRIDLRQDILSEADGPMLIHGLQRFQDAKILVPREGESKPNPDFLEERYAIFCRKAG